MGELSRHPVGRWQRDYHLQNFVETGLYKGNGLFRALQDPFERLYSIECSAEFIAAVQAKLPPKHAGRVTLIHGDSAEEVRELLDWGLPDGPTLWWLDAHYPDRYQGEAVEWLPLLCEAAAIIGHERDHSGDVFLIDDCRVYGEVGASGPLPDLPGLKPGDEYDLAAIRSDLSGTHDVQLDRRDGTYLIATPR